MRVLITGATGFLGRHLVAHLEKTNVNGKPPHIVALGSKDGCLTDETTLHKFNSQTFDYIYHLAAWTQAGDFCLYHPGEQWLINQKMNTTVLNWWLRFQPQAKLISIGTSCAYDPNLPLSEDNYLTGKPIDSLFTYAMTKRMLYTGLRALSSQYGLKYMHLVPSTLYGPGYPLDGRQMHFIFDLVRKVIRGKAYGEKVVLWGDGNQKRELIHVDDFTRIMLELAQSKTNEIVNIGAGEEFSIRSFAQLICQHLDYDFDNIVFDTTAYVGARSKCLDISKLKSMMPSLKLTPLKKGLGDTIDHFWLEREKLPAGKA